MVAVAKLVKAVDCDSTIRGFESHLSPQFYDLWLGSIVGLIRRPVTAEIDGSNPFRVAKLLYNYEYFS